MTNDDFDAVANAVVQILANELNAEDFHYENNVKNITDKVNNCWTDGDTVQTLLAKCQ